MRWTIRRAHVWHGSDGYKVVISETAWWAVAASVGYDRLMDTIGHPCCGLGLGRVGPVFDAAWKLLLATVALDFDHTYRRVEIPVGADIARELWLGDWDEWQEILADDADESDGAP